MSGIWRIWMQVWCWATLALGVVFALGALPGPDIGVRVFYDTIYWPIDGASPFGEQVRLTAALLGAVMIGWAITIFTLVEAAQKIGAPAWRGLTFGMIAWYAIDSTISVWLGAPVNALSNTMFTVSYLIPVLASGVLGHSQGALSAQRS